MRHAFVDNYADLDTPLHRINPRVKIIFSTPFLLLIVLSPINYPGLFLLYGFVIAILIYLSRVPLRFISERVFEALPFIIFIAISALFRKAGFVLFLNCAVKATLTLCLVLIVSCTTRFSHLLEALRQLKVPKLFIQLLSFMYRYSFLLEDQLLRCRRAYDSRNINGKNNFRKARIFSNILGTVFIRTYERAERLYLAMCARGYENEKNN